MGGASSFLAILAICGFLSAAWMATKVSKMAGVSSIVLEIATGVVLGPRVLQLISPEYAVCEHSRHAECELPPDFDQRLKEGLPLGQYLGRIASMDYCPRDLYLHHDGPGHTDEHVDGHANGDVEVAGGHGGGHVDGHASNHSDGLAGGQGHTNEHAAQHAENTSHGAEHGDNGSAHTTATPSGDAPLPHEGQDDNGRQLSGGGGATYGSYGECLQKSCEADVSHHCGLTPDVFTLIGHAGVALMIFESGMHFDFEKAAVVGPKACCVAVLGTILPLISGAILTMIYGKPLLPDAISVGTALAPTSVGIALRLLGEAGVLQQDFGQAIITAAFVDDILSLILFNVLFSLRGEFDVIKVVVFPIVGVIFMGIAMVAAVKFWPQIISDVILPRIPVKTGAKVSSADEALFLIMFALLIVYGTITHFLGTHLWGCFIAGMSFACVRPLHHPHHVWVKQTKRMTSWMIRIFFSCTVAFSIPVSKLLSFEAFWKGSLMGIGPCILTKVLCAPFMGDAKFVIGWAMVGRAEFAYLIAQMAAAGSMIDEDTFSICIWALLYATIFAPFIFRTVLNRYIARQGFAVDNEAAKHGNEDDVGFVEDHASHSAKQQSKDKLDFGANEVEKSTYGKASELEDIKLDLESSDVKPGRQQRKVKEQHLVRKGNGFLCCLFYKKAFMS